MHPLLPLLAFLTPCLGRYTINLPPTLHTGSIHADFLTPTIDNSDLDSPKLSAVNASSFEWWTFDAFDAENSNASFAITFVNAGHSGYPLAFPSDDGLGNNNTDSTSDPEYRDMREDSHTLYAHLSLSFPNGSTLTHTEKVNSARLHGSGDSIVSLWNGVGGWMGSEEGFEVEVGIDRPEVGVNVSGRVSFERITDPHSVCSLPGPGNFSDHLAIGDRGLGWVSVMPDAIATVEVEANGERLGFVGYGSHDKIWTSSPFTQSTKSLTRGRAHVGLYSLLWLSYTPSTPSTPSTPTNPDPNTPNQEIVSSFIALDGLTTSSGCTPHSVTIEQGTEMADGEVVSGWRVTVPGGQVRVAADIDLGMVGQGQGESGEEGEGRYERWVGRARGVFGTGAGVQEGGAVFERFLY